MDEFGNLTPVAQPGDYFQKQSRLASEIHRQSLMQGSPGLRERAQSIARSSRLGVNTLAGDLRRTASDSMLGASTLAGDIFNTNMFWQLQMNAQRVSDEMTPAYMPLYRSIVNANRFSHQYLQQYYSTEYGLRGGYLQPGTDWMRYVASPIRGTIGAVGDVLSHFGMPRGYLREAAANIGLYRDPTGTARQLAYSGQRLWGQRAVDDPVSVGRMAHRAASVYERETAGLDPKYKEAIMAAGLATGRVNFRDVKDGDEAARKMVEYTREIDNLRRSMQMTTKDFQEFSSKLGPSMFEVASPGMSLALQEMTDKGNFVGAQMAMALSAQGYQAFSSMMSRPQARTAAMGIQSMLDSRLTELYDPTRVASERVGLVRAVQQMPDAGLITAGFSAGARDIPSAIAAGVGMLSRPGGLVTFQEKAAYGMAGMEEMARELIRNIFPGESISDIMANDNKRRIAIQNISEMYGLSIPQARQVAESLGKEATAVQSVAGLRFKGRVPVTELKTGGGGPGMSAGTSRALHGSGLLEGIFSGMPSEDARETTGYRNVTVPENLSKQLMQGLEMIQPMLTGEQVEQAGRMLGRAEGSHNRGRDAQEEDRLLMDLLTRLGQGEDVSSQIAKLLEGEAAGTLVEEILEMKKTVASLDDILSNLEDAKSVLSATGVNW